MLLSTNAEYIFFNCWESFKRKRHPTFKNSIMIVDIKTNVRDSAGKWYGENSMRMPPCAYKWFYKICVSVTGPNGYLSMFKTIAILKSFGYTVLYLAMIKWSSD